MPGRTEGSWAMWKSRDPLLFPALVSGKAQGKNFTAESLFPTFLSCRNSGKQQRQCEHFPFLCKHVLFMGCRCQRSSWSSRCHASPAASGCGAGVLPLHHPRRAARGTRAVTRACCTRLFLVHVGVLLGKNPKSLLQNKLLQCRVTELRSYIFF